jgi:hypothetical protein
MAEVAKAIAKEVRRAKALAAAGAGHSAIDPSTSKETRVSLADALIGAAGASMVAPSGGMCSTPPVHLSQALGLSNGSPSHTSHMDAGHNPATGAEVGTRPPTYGAPTYTPEVQSNRDHESIPLCAARRSPHASTRVGPP